DAFTGGKVMTRGFEVAKLDGGHVSLTSAALKDLGNRMAGDLLCAGDAGWEDAVRIWNRMVDSVPALVVQPTSSDDVSAAVKFASEHELLISVKGGGHN